MSIELSKRATRVLSELLGGQKITPRAVARFKYQQVRLHSGCGCTTAREIEQWLWDHDLKFPGGKALWSAAQVSKLSRMYDKMSKEHHALVRRLKRRQKNIAKTYMRTRPAKKASARTSH